MITEAQVFLTRKCNMNCGYCKLVENNSLKELDLGDWMKAYRVMERIGIRTVKLMGGEPTVKPWLPDLLRFSARSSIKTAVLSNSMFDEVTRRRIVDSLPWGYFASVDSLKDINSHKDPVKKSITGYQMLKSMEYTNIPIRAANIVINRFNMHDVVAIVQKLSDERIWCNLCSVQFSKDSSKEFSKTDVKPDYLFREEDREPLKKICAELIQMKREGAKISIPESYIRDIPKYGIYCNWQCKDIFQLRIDSDGGLMLCNEHRTKLAENYNILNLTEEKYEEFLRQWYVARSHINCAGCYWSCFLQAEDNIKNQKLEFDYAS